MQERNTKIEQESQEGAFAEVVSNSAADSEMAGEEMARALVAEGETARGGEGQKQEENEDDAQNISAEAGRKRNTMRKCKVAAKVFLSFALLVAALAAIGFSVLWLIDNAQSVKFWEKDAKQPASEVFMNADNELSEGNLESDAMNVESGSEESSDSGEKTESGAMGTTVDLSDPAALKVLVLNGGGAKGSAGKAQTYLKEKGYVLTDASNASVFTYKDVTVFYADEKNKADAEKLQEVLGEEYKTVEVNPAESADEKKSDIVVIIGKS